LCRHIEPAWGAGGITVKNAGSSDWKTIALPTKRTTIALSRSFSENEMEMIRKGLIPEEMEDKWFIYWQDNTLFFHRSWTGYCIFVVRFVPKEDSWETVEADLNRDPGQYRETSDEKDAGLIFFLIDLLLLHKRDASFPCRGKDAMEHALMGWSMVGRAMTGQHPNKDEENRQ